jgi:ComF family protein
MKSKLLQRVTALIYPNRCFICDKVVPYPETVCENCRPKIIRYSQLSGAVCDICGLKLDRCGCRPNRLYEKAVFPLLFEDDVRASLHRFKFRNRTDKAKPFAEAIKTALEERELLQDVELLTFIPMGKKALRKRGYNQAQLLCEELQKATHLPMLPLLYKYSANATQHDLKDYMFRSGNILGVYEPDPQYADQIEGKRILLVDDILTSGATLNEAAKTLLIFGAESVYVAAAAAVPKKNKKTDEQVKN